MESSELILRRPLSPREQFMDAAAAVALLAAVWLQMSAPRLMLGPGRGIPRAMMPFGRPESTPLAAFLLVAVCVLPLALRRRYPLAVLGVVAASFAAYQALGFPPSMAVMGVLVALYTLGTLTDRRRLVIWGLVFGALVVVSGLPMWGAERFWPDLALTFSVLAVPAAIGDGTRNRRAYVAEVEHRAAEAERTREEEALRRVDEERLRIARELHDITAHSLAIVAVQSGAALHVLDTDPVAARGALVAIRDTSRNALNELRAILGVLRGSGEVPEGAPLAPTPGLARVPDLVAPLRDAGLAVELIAPGIADPLSAFVDASGYRIVQEALTNVLRHAGTAAVRATISRDDEALSIEVVDDGAATPATAAASEGHGIAGMRERALALGGTFEAGPVDGGGWRVAATLPLKGRGQS